MINLPELALGYCYFDFPEERIVVTVLLESSRDFNIILELPERENMVPRTKYNLPVFNA